MIAPAESDLEKCPLCGMTCLLVAYWDQVRQKEMVKRVQVRFANVYQFTRRSARGYLIVWEKETVMANHHNWECPTMPPAQSQAAKEDEEKSGGLWRKEP